MDLFHIGSTILKDSRKRAQSFVEEIYDRCHELKDMAYSYPLLPDHGESGIRRRVYGQYLIFYRVVDDDVEIVHILHGAMDYQSILFPKD